MGIRVKGNSRGKDNETGKCVLLETDVERLHEVYEQIGEFLATVKVPRKKKQQKERADTNDPELFKRIEKVLCENTNARGIDIAKGARVSRRTLSKNKEIADFIAKTKAERKSYVEKRHARKKNEA
jgi:hypothetical protein